MRVKGKGFFSNYEGKRMMYTNFKWLFPYYSKILPKKCQVSSGYWAVNSGIRNLQSVLEQLMCPSNKHLNATLDLFPVDKP